MTGQRGKDDPDDSWYPKLSPEWKAKAEEIRRKWALATELRRSGRAKTWTEAQQMAGILPMPPEGEVQDDSVEK